MTTRSLTSKILTPAPKFTHRLSLVLVACSALASCTTHSSPPLKDIGPRPEAWTGRDYTKNGKKAGHIWLSPDRGHPFVQQTRITRKPSETVDDIVSDVKSGHTIDSVRHYRVNGIQVVDVRCRPFPQNTPPPSLTRFLIFQENTYFDSIMLNGSSKAVLNGPAFKQIYRRLGVGDY